MQTSENVAELAAALAKAQAAMKHAPKEKTNPHFKSKYADLASYWEACREALSANNLSVVQVPALAGQGVVAIHTALLHASGQWIRGVLEVPMAQNTAQAMGSAITYGRRYALAAMVGMAQDDDDGQATTRADTFDMKDEAQRERMKKTLTSRGVPDDIQKSIAKAMHGEPWAQLEATIQSFREGAQ